MPKALVRKRCFVQMMGYEPVGPDRQHHRFVREMARFHKAWNVQGNVSRPKISEDGSVASWTVDTFGPNWRVTHGFSLFPLGRLRHRRHGRQRLVAVSARHCRIDGIRADRNGRALFHRRLALRRIFSLSAGLHPRHDVAVDCGDAVCRDPYRMRPAVPHGAGAGAVARDFHGVFAGRSGGWSRSATRSTIGILRATSFIARGRGSKRGSTVWPANWCALPATPTPTRSLSTATASVRRCRSWSSTVLCSSIRNSAPAASRCIWFRPARRS